MVASLDAAFKQADRDTARDRLYAAAVRCMQDAKLDVGRASKQFMHMLSGDGAMLAALAEFYLANVIVPDMQKPNSGSEGQVIRAALSGHAIVANASGTERDGEAMHATPQGQSNVANPSQPEASGEGLTTLAMMIGRDIDTSPARPPVTLTEAGRVLQKARAPGAGAMSARSYETRLAIRGESWLMSYAIPGGPAVLEMTWDSAEAMECRMIGEGGERLHAGVLLRALRKEGEALGRIAGHQVIGKTLPPAAIKRVADELEPQKAATKARAWLRKFQAEELTHGA